MAEPIAEQLADKVVSGVRKSGVREDILEALLKAVESSVRERAVDALLAAIGHAAVQRDREWVRQLQGEWTPRSGLKTATTPAEVEQEMRSWMQAKITEARQTGYGAGYEDAFPVALEQGARLGWGGHEAGKNLEAVLVAVKKTPVKARL